MDTPGFVDSKFRLAILVAKRAKQIVNGARKKIEMDAENPLTIALEEVYQGKINFYIYDDEDEFLMLKRQEEQEYKDDLLDDEYEEVEGDDIIADEEVELDEETDDKDLSEDELEL